ncbi:MAG: DUF333 domain-containing protein [Ilumatobacteraceae bacterium]
MRRNSLAALVLVLGATLAACGSDDAPSDTTPSSGPPQMANPASEFCISEGGTLEIVDEADGQVGYCTLADGTRVEEWEYYRSQTGNTQP